MSENTVKSAEDELAAIEDLISQGVNGDDNPDVAMRRLTLLGAIQHLAGNAEQAIPKFEQALTLARGLYGDHDSTVAMLQCNLDAAHASTTLMHNKR